MIEIIKEGKPNVPIFRATCSECQCVFQFHRKDIKFYDTRIAIDEWKETWYIKCPCCGIEKNSWSQLRRSNGLISDKHY